MNRILVIVCLVAIIVINVVKNPYFLAAMGIIAFLLLIYTRTERRYSLRSLLLIMLMAFGVSLIQALTIGTNVIYNLCIFCLSTDIYREGLNLGTLTVLRVWGGISVIFLLMSVMKFEEFLDVLKWMKVPGAFIEVMTFAVKFIHIFKEEVSAIRKAQRARLGYGSFMKSARSLADIAGIVLTRAYDRSRMLEKSMKSRGYAEASGIEKDE